MATDLDIDTILAAHRDRSDAEILELYETVRTQVLTAAYTEHGTVEIEIRQRRHRVSDPEKFLAFLERQIQFYRQRVQSAQYGASRNYAHQGCRTGSTSCGKGRCR